MGPTTPFGWARTGVSALVTASGERGPTLDEARYVIKEVQVGGYAATLADFEIPARYGVRQTIGDTLGICSTTPTRWRCCRGRSTRALALVASSACVTRCGTRTRSWPGSSARVQIFRWFGYFPTESSEHSAEYVPWFMRHDDQVEQYRIFVGDYLSRSQENLAELASLQEQLKAGGDIDLERTDELASQFTGVPRR